MEVGQSQASVQGRVGASIMGLNSVATIELENNAGKSS